ncbi:MAG: TonB family protein [Candidatus Omnitrophica bacterium]|jgi:pilus assembly protein CpaC|nr:TonB family protein [Candidatus Omnitrophota bacterium]
MLRKIFIHISFIVFLLTNSFSFSQNIFEPLAEDEYTLVSGEAMAIAVSFPQRVSMRDPETADITKVSDKEIVIVAKKPGETTLTIWNKDGEKTYYITVYSQDLDRVLMRLEKLIRRDLKISNVVLKKNEATGKIIIAGDITSIEKEQIDKVVESFKDRVDNILTVKKETKMVEIEARILELNKSDLDRLGVKWQEYIQIRQEPYVAPAASATGVSTTLNIQKPWTAAWGMGSWSRDALTARIDMLVRDGKGKELSRPKLLCLSGEEAKLSVGGEVPYLSGSTTGSAGTSVSVSYKEYGVILKIRPIVSSDNKKIYASMRAEVSALDLVNAITVSGTRVPAFTTRIAETVLNLKSGDTIFIAGLIKQKDSESIDKLPALGNLPVIGALFRSKEFQNSQTELVISLTPKVIPLDDKEEIPEVKEVSEKKNLELYTGIIPNNLQNYVLDVQDEIANNISYPPSLMQTGWEGMVVLKLNINQTGDIKDVKITKSSGHRIFDTDAVKLVRSLTFPPFPPDSDIRELNIDVPIVYREKNKR